MSSPSVLYALENIERLRPERRTKTLLMSFGSGFKVNTLVLHKEQAQTFEKPSRWAVVVGGTSGIGLETSKSLMRRGYRVMVGSRRIGTIETTPEGLIQIPLDVRDPESVRHFAKSVWNQSFGIDALVVSSGIAGTPAKVETMDLEAMANVIDVNLTGAMRVTAALLPSMRRGGKVVLVNSILGTIPLRSNAAYCASKAGLRHFAEVLRIEQARAGRGVRVHSIFPSYVATPMLESVQSQSKTLMRPLSVERVANTIVRTVEGGRTRAWFKLRDRGLAWLHRSWPSVYRWLAVRFA